MTRDEKLAVIAGNLRESGQGIDRCSALCNGSLFELAVIAAESGDSGYALDLAKLVLPQNNRTMLAEFCRSYQKYRGYSEKPLSLPESSELPYTVMIPEISRLDEALLLLAGKGVRLDREYGDSFSACAENVEYGHSRYVLMPLKDPAEGRLRSFDRLRENYGLKIHCVICVPSDGGGNYEYQLCGLGFPDYAEMSASRLSFTADTGSDVIEYLGGVKVFGAGVLSAEFELNTDTARIRAVLDIGGLDYAALSGLLMYLNTDADMTIDGCYAEI